MRVVVMSLAACAVLAGCAAGPEADVALACEAQGFRPGTEEFRVCVDADGAEIATGPGSPYANVDEDENGL